MNQEIETLRKILGAHEDKMTEAGMMVESHREILDRQFWAGVPESGKRTVLLSTEAWCIPPRNVQSYVGAVDRAGQYRGRDQHPAELCVVRRQRRKRRPQENRCWVCPQMAELYAKVDPKLLVEALRHLGLRLSIEQDAELQGLVSAAFVRLARRPPPAAAIPPWSRRSI